MNNKQKNKKKLKNALLYRYKVENIDKSNIEPKLKIGLEELSKYLSEIRLNQRKVTKEEVLEQLRKINAAVVKSGRPPIINEK